MYMTRYMYDIPLGDSLQRQLLEITQEGYSLPPHREKTLTDEYGEMVKKKKVIKKVV